MTKIWGPALAVLALTASCQAQFSCGTGGVTLQADKLHDTIVGLFDAQGVKASAVDCGALPKPKQGDTFNCTATVDGKPVTVVVTETDNRGAVHLAAKDVVFTRAMAHLLEQRIKEKSGKDVTVDCGARMVPETEGQTFTCTAPDPTAPPHSFKITLHGGGKYDVDAQ